MTDKLSKPENGETHELKTWPEYFEAIASGEKTFDLRKNDRGFEVGDTLRLREWSPETKSYTGREISRTVGYILPHLPQAGCVATFGLQENHVIMALRVPAQIQPDREQLAAKLLSMWKHGNSPLEIVDALIPALPPQESASPQEGFNGVAIVSPEEFDEIVHNLENPSGPSDATLRGAELLRKLYPRPRSQEASDTSDSK